MATVIDSLVLEFGLDDTKFDRAQREAIGRLRNFELAALKSGTEIERQQVKLNDLFMNFRREAVGALGIFLGGRGIAEFAQHIMNLNLETGKLARTTGIATGELSSWQGAARTMGGTAEGISGTLQAITQDLQTLLISPDKSQMASTMRPFMQLFGPNGQIKTATEVLEDFADQAEKMDPERFAALAKLTIPGASDEAIQLMLLGKTRLHELLEEQRRIPGVTSEGAAAAMEYQHALANTERAAEGLGHRLLTVLEPAILKITEDIQYALSGGKPFALTKGGFAEWVWKSLTNQHEGMGGMWQDFKDIFDPAKRARGAAETELAAGLQRRAVLGGFGYGGAGGGAAGGGNVNWTNFLRGLTFLETGGRDIPDPRSTARGYFHFTDATARDAIMAGVGNPRAGGYADQAGVARRFIERFHPEAAAAIEAGNWDLAFQLLKQRWVSLPGGQQPQPGKYAEFRQILAGGGGTSNVYHINTLNQYGVQDMQKGLDAVKNRAPNQAVPFNGP